MTLDFQTRLDGAIVVNGVTRIALPSSNWGTSVHPANGFDAPRSHAATLEPRTFVAGPENQLVVPAIERLLSEDDRTQCDRLSTELFNPLVLLGPTGTGKSQLARAITRHWSTSHSAAAVEYLTAVDFARQLRAARETNELESFRQRLDNLELFVLEDLHRVPSSIYVQRELRDTLEQLLTAGVAIVVTTQQPPAAMASLEAGLRDRLTYGLTIRLQNPGYEARLALLELAATARGLSLDGDQLQHLAHKIEGTAPQLFRALAEYELTTKTETPIADTRPPLKLKQIVAVVARYYSLTQAALCSSARRKSLVHARGIAIHLARKLTNQSYAQIGQMLGRRDHSTIMHASRAIEKRLASDASAQHDVEELKRILTAV